MNIDRVLAAAVYKMLRANKALGGDGTFTVSKGEIAAFEKSGKWVFVEECGAESYRFALDTIENIKKRKANGTRS